MERETIPVDFCFIDGGIVYKCVEDDGFHGCKDCAFLCAPDECAVCSAPNFLRCSADYRSDSKYVRFVEIGQLFEI